MFCTYPSAQPFLRAKEARGTRERFFAACGAVGPGPTFDGLSEANRGTVVAAVADRTALDIGSPRVTSISANLAFVRFVIDCSSWTVVTRWTESAGLAEARLIAVIARWAFLRKTGYFYGKKTL